ncbi:MAG: alpha/beta hydrolase fold domain-containing protein [Bacteroidales bacterium]|nr:alpha/beta hydrolase fold domain-containing protein [Bacteroidales bacterium]
MKKLIILILLFLNFSAYSQRYLSYVFSELDSVIGGNYGYAIDYLGNNQNLLFDFYAPRLDPVQQRPLIIYIHGGGFTSGTREYQSIKLLSQKMARKGYAVASIDYRLDPKFRLYDSESDRRAMTDAMHDAKQAIRYFKANAEYFKIDTNRVFIGGESAGAITAMMAAYVDKQDEMIPYPMANPNNPIGSSSNSHVGNQVHAIMCLCGMFIDPTAIESSNEAPILWTHGSADTYIPISLAFNIVLRASNIGLPVQTHVYEGATHCPWYYGNPDWEAYLDSTVNDITTFLYPKVETALSLFELQDSEISMSPNPCKDYLNISLNKHYPQVNISLASLTAQVYQNWRFENANEACLDLKGLASGLYIVRVEYDKSIHFQKILINKI